MSKNIIFRAEQSRAEQSRAEQSRAEQSRAEQSRAGRNYGIDALRIVSMLMIVHLHMLGHGGLLGTVVPVTSQYAAAWLIEIICYGGVNIYALISGFVGYRNELNYSRLLKLWLQVFFYSTVIYALIVMLGIEKFSVKSLLTVVLPVLRKHYWYISAYFGMIMLTPFINVAIRNCTEKLAKYLLFVTLVGYVTIPCLAIQSDPASLNSGYTAFWLLLMYIIGALSSKFEWYKKCSSLKIGIIVIMMFLITWISRLVIAFLTLKLFGKALGAGLLVSYISPTIFIASLGLLYIFGNMKIKPDSFIERLIRILAPATLGVYLIHEHFAIRSHFVKGLTSSLCNDNALLLIVKIFSIAVAVYAVCTVIEFVRAKAFKVLKIDKLCDGVVNGLQKFYE